MYYYEKPRSLSSISRLKHPEKTRIYFWKIQGEAANDSNGGSETIFAMTPNSWTLPNVNDALEIARPGFTWYSVDSIEQVGDMPTAIDHRDLPHFIRERIAGKAVCNG